MNIFADGLRIFVDYSSVNVSSSEMFIDGRIYESWFSYDDFLSYHLSEEWFGECSFSLRNLLQNGIYELRPEDELYHQVLLIIRANEI